MDPSARPLDSAILGFIRRYEAAEEAPESEFQALALKLFFHQYQKNKFYRRFCDIEGKGPSNIHNWKEIPAMPADGFKEFYLASFPQKNSIRVFRTSGTTKEKRGKHYFDTLSLYRAAILKPFQKYLLPDRGRMEMFFLMEPPERLADSSLSFMMGEVLKNFGTRQKNRFYIKNGKPFFEKLTQDLTDQKKPVMLLSTAFSLKGFLDHLGTNKKKIVLKRGSRIMETGGFKGRVKEISKRDLYRECEKTLGVPRSHCVSEYGMTELSSQYYDTTLRDKVQGVRRKFFKAGPAWMRALVIDPRSGKEARVGGRGILRHYDLANRGSVLAVQTEDWAVRLRRGFEVIGRVQRSSLRGCSLTYEEFLSS